MYTDSENIFVSKLYDLVEAVHYKKYPDKRSKKKCIEEKYNDCRWVIDRIRDLKTSLSFQDMWQFAEFIITMEKVYFYQNVQSSDVCCDKCSVLERILFFNYEKKNLYIKIGMYRSSVDTIKIAVYRNWGNKECTQFKVEGQECNITSDSDHMLVNTVNAYVQNTIANLYESYVYLAYTGNIYDVILGETDSKDRKEVKLNEKVR